MEDLADTSATGASPVGSLDWWTEREERLRRRRPRVDGLTIEAIIDAALTVIDAEGLDALTMRRLADGLSTGSASLYRHVASRDELRRVLVICDMMGIPRSEFQTVLDATNVILGAGDPEFLGGKEPFPAMLEAGMTLTAMMDELAAERRKNPTDDLTSALVHNTIGEEMLAPEEVAPFFILLAVAGNDTTRTATSLGMHLLAQNPDQRRIWQDDLDGVTTTAVEEIVRMASPVTFMRRTATKDITLGDHTFNEGDRMILFYGAANRDPRAFDDPETFDVRRDPNPHVGFGGPGPHFCLGAHLARRELSVVFRQLFTRLPDIEVIGEPDYLQVAGVPLVGGVKRLPVRFTPTAPVGR